MPVSTFVHVRTQRRLHTTASSALTHDATTIILLYCCHCSGLVAACRLTCPWPALVEWCSSFDLQTVDKHVHQHLPYGETKQHASCCAVLCYVVYGLQYVVMPLLPATPLMQLLGPNRTPPQGGKQDPLQQSQTLARCSVLCQARAVVLLLQALQDRRASSGYTPAVTAVQTRVLCHGVLCCAPAVVLLLQALHSWRAF